MDDLKLCDSEYRFMLLVWEAAPVRSGELVRLASGPVTGACKRNTVIKFIRFFRLFFYKFGKQRYQFFDSFPSFFN